MNSYRLGAVAGLIVILLSVPVFVLSSYRLGLLSLVASYAVASLAQNLLAGYAAVPSLGNVAFFATGAFVTGALCSTGRPAVLGILAGVLAAGAVGLVVGLPALRISGMHFAIVTVVLVLVAQELMGQWLQTNTTSGDVTVTHPSWLLQDRWLYLAAVVVAVFMYAAIWNLLRSRSGRALLAINDDPQAAATVGVNVTLYRLTAFVVSGMLTGLAGVVYLYYAHTITSQAFTLDLSVAFLAMMVVGGARSLGGSVLGALIVGLLPQLLDALPPNVAGIDVRGSSAALYAVLLLVTLRFVPDGLWNVWRPRSRPLP